MQSQKNIKAIIFEKTKNTSSTSMKEIIELLGIDVIDIDNYFFIKNCLLEFGFDYKDFGAVERVNVSYKSDENETIIRTAENFEFIKKQ